MKSERETEGGEGVESRVDALIDTFASRNQAAQVAGLSVEQLRRYQRGASPRLLPIARLCRAADWSVDYVCYGRRPGVNYAQSPERDRGEKNLRDEESVVVELPAYDLRASARGTSIDRQLFAWRPAQHGGRAPEDLALAWIDASPVRLARGDSEVLLDVSVQHVGAAGLYVLRSAQAWVVRVVQPDFRGGLVISSGDDPHADIHVPPGAVDEVRVVARAIWAASVL